MGDKVFSLEWKKYRLKRCGSVKWNVTRDLTRAVSVLAALEKREEERESKCG